MCCPPPSCTSESAQTALCSGSHCQSAIPRVSSTSGTPGEDILLSGSSIPPCPHTVTTPIKPKMTTETRRILAVPGGQRLRSDLVEARGSNPPRMQLHQRTLSVRPSPAFPFPWKVFPGKFSLESFPWKVFPRKFSDPFICRSNRCSLPPKTQ